MKIDLILLSGTPASGKDTITSEMIKIDNKFTHFKKHKIATGGKMDDTYFLVPKDTFDEMAENNKFVQYHYRYDRGYGVSYEELVNNKNMGKIPIIHVGKYENIAKFREYGLKNILSILIYTNRDTTLNRLQTRHKDNADEIQNRINAYDEEIKQLCSVYNSNTKIDFDLVIKNNEDDISGVTKEILEKISYFENEIDTVDGVLNC
jgi:guanylate kinase